MFANVLRRISFANGTPYDTPNWRHFSIAERCRFLARSAVDPNAVFELQRSITTAVVSVTSVGLAALLVVCAELVVGLL
jgi:hypothetical protein